MSGQEKRAAEGEESGGAYIAPSEGEGRGLSANSLISGKDLETPRIAAEREIGLTVQIAGQRIRDLLTMGQAESQAEAMSMRVQATLAMQVLEAANAIAERGRGQQQTKPLAATTQLQPGALALQLAQRMAAKRNTHAVQRRVVEVVPEGRAIVDPYAMKEREPVQPTASAADGVSDQDKVDAADGGNS